MKLIALVVVALISAGGCTRKSIELTPNARGLYSDWWQNAVLYQIYPRSFKDADNDGDGDLQGIISKLDHLVDTGVDAVWLSPIYKSPQVDNGYDISDYRDVESMYGTLEDLRQLRNEAHQRNLKLILDYVPNHTSDQHAWFQSSLNSEPGYEDFYIWRNASYVDGERRPPNNWVSNFGGSAWEWNEQRQQYYFHQFAPAQPDLNYRNPQVVEAMKDVLRYWMDFGVDGFRMDAVYTLFERIDLPDEPLSGDTDDPQSYGYLSHIYTIDQNETMDMIYQWRDLLDEYSQNDTTKIMMTEVYSEIEAAMLYYANANLTRLGAHFTFNFHTFILDTKLGFTAQDLYDNIDLWLQNLPPGFTSNWVLGNHDQTRVATRLGVENIDPLNMLASLLPGVQVTYQGEEIGQESGEVTCEQGYDPQAIKNCSIFNQTSRDFERTPFQWDNTTNAGFNEGHPAWLPVSSKYPQTNLAIQLPTKSHFNIYKSLLKIKRDFKNTTTDNLVISYESNGFYIERLTDNAHYAFIYNVGDSPSVFGYGQDGVEVVVSSLNSQYSTGDAYNVTNALRPKEAVLLRLNL